MKSPHLTRQAGRPSFTLVELLVVIAIIGVLVGLLLAAVFKVLDAAYEAQTRTDVTQLAGAVEAFKQKYGASYIPSRIVLNKVVANYSQPGPLYQLRQESLQYLSQLWPKLQPSPGQFTGWNTPQPPGVPPQWYGIDWDVNGLPGFTVTLTNGSQTVVPEIILEGEQCLVFFLGGIPDYFSGTMSGFSTNPSNPAQPGGDRVPPFFDFKSSRLVKLTTYMYPANTNLNGLINDFPVYMDGYGKTPYAYFSSYKNMNGYNRYAGVPFAYSNMPPYNNTLPSDCQLLQVFPYALSGVYPPNPPPTQPLPPPVYLNSQTYQIISAGKNYQFGPGTVLVGQTPQGNWLGGPVWSPATASMIYPQGQGGYDDISNFYDRLLGVSSQ